MRLGEQIEVEIEKGKTLIVQLSSISEPKADGTRVLYFEINSQTREVLIKDVNIKTTVLARLKANLRNQSQIGASMPGTVLKLLVEKGQTVLKDDHLMITEA
jgi:pyruvate carboxylase